MICLPLVDSPQGRCAGVMPGPVLRALGVLDTAADLDNCARGTQVPGNPEPSRDAHAAASRSDTERRPSPVPTTADHTNAVAAPR